MKACGCVVQYACIAAILLFGCNHVQQPIAYIDKIEFDDLSIEVKLPASPMDRREEDTVARRFVRKSVVYKLDTIIDVELTCSKYLKDTPKALLKHLEE